MTTIKSNDQLKDIDSYKNNHSQRIDKLLISGIIDELFLDLCFTKYKVLDIARNKELRVSKYYLQAYELLPLIPVGNPNPSFVIWLSDLKPTTIEGLVNEEGHRMFVISQAIGTIFENISPNLFHLGVLRRLRWELRD